MTQEEVIEIIKDHNPKKYKKVGNVSYRIAKEDFILETIIDGVKETEKPAKKGDVIITGPKGEEYIPGNDKFYSRYEVIDEKTAKPKGVFYGNYYYGEPITFTAHWGEEMICNYGDVLGSPDEEFSEAYRIESNIFKTTYRKAFLDEDLKEKWVKDLESGKYQQGKDRLYNKHDNTYCCLGVLARICNMKISDNRDTIEDESGNELDYIPLFKLFQEDNSVGLPSTLIAMNDDGSTFQEIAQKIREEA